MQVEAELPCLVGVGDQLRGGCSPGLPVDTDHPVAVSHGLKGHSDADEQRSGIERSPSCAVAVRYRRPPPRQAASLSWTVCAGPTSSCAITRRWFDEVENREDCADIVGGDRHFTHAISGMVGRHAERQCRNVQVSDISYERGERSLLPRHLRSVRRSTSNRSAVAVSVRPSSAARAARVLAAAVAASSSVRAW